MTRTLKVADRDPLMNPRILEPRFGGAFFWTFVASALADACDFSA
jgi:hypothetical protein